MSQGESAIGVMMSQKCPMSHLWVTTQGNESEGVITSTGPATAKMGKREEGERHGVSHDITPLLMS